MKLFDIKWPSHNKDDIDKTAAAIFLQQFLDTNRL